MHKNPSLERYGVLVAKGCARWGDPALGVLFGQYIDGLPWCGNRPDLGQNKKLKILDFYGCSDSEIREFIISSRLSMYEEVVLHVQDGCDVLITSFKKFSEQPLDFLTSPGDAMVCGYNSEKSVVCEDYMLVFSWTAYAVFD